jgi:hypothetical protein
MDMRMFRSVLAATLLLSSPLSAQEVAERVVAIQPSPPYYKSYVRLEKKPYGADLTFFNQLTGDPCCDTYELKVDGITVTYTIETVGPPKGRELEGRNYPDIIRVTEVSGGLIANPEILVVDEESFGVIHIMPGMS